MRKCLDYDCFSVGSKKGNIKKVDRIVEYIHFGPHGMEIFGDFFVTNPTEELDYLVVLHPGSARVQNYTWPGWKVRPDHRTDLFCRLNNIEHAYAGCVRIGETVYEAGPIGPKPCPIAGGYSETEDLPFTEFKLGPIVNGSFVLRVHFDVGPVTNTNMINGGFPAIYGGVTLLNKIEEQSLPSASREELDTFINQRHCNVDKYEVIVHADNPAQLPTVLRSANTVEPNKCAARDAGCLWFMADGNDTGVFEIHLELKGEPR